MIRRRSCIPGFLVMVLLVIIGLVAMAVYIPAMARQSFGPPDPRLNSLQRFTYAFDLVWNAGDLTQPPDPAGAEKIFVIQPGESVNSISVRLEQAGLIRNSATFRTYLLWTGLDTIIQTGTFRFSPSQTGRDIAQMLKSTTLPEVKFSVLPGWRLEEIAAGLPSSGLDISPSAFLAAAAAPANPLGFLPAGASAEGFLLPGTYTLPRSTSADQLVLLLMQSFSSGLTPELQSGFTSHGLTVFQAVTLASIIQREAVVTDEMPMIASVFYNHLAVNMRLQTDPTVQYALGYNAARATWWTTPLSLQDLKVDSPYNTYLHPGLPPGPISDPGLAALQAVAAPAQSKYFYFQARCDKSGLHNFAETLTQHQQNNCP